jgi:hypothetical protein
MRLPIRGRVRVDIDQPRHHHERAAIDLAVGVAGECPADMSELAARECDVTGRVNVRAALIGDNPVDIANDGCRHAARPLSLDCA